MSECKNLRNAQPGQKVFCRDSHQGDLFVARTHEIVANDDDLTKRRFFKYDIILRFETGLNEEGYFDITFTPDGQHRAGGWQKCGHAIYPMTKKYKAIYELEKRYAKA